MQTLTFMFSFMDIHLVVSYMPRSRLKEGHSSCTKSLTPYLESVKYKVKETRTVLMMIDKDIFLPHKVKTQHVQI